MWKWLERKLQRAQSQSLWSVAILDDNIVTTDGMGAVRTISIADLTSIVVATDDSGPRGDDVVFLLYGGSEPLTIFPLEAHGCQDFVNWMASKPGYHDRELAKAMASTRVARFVVWTS